MGTIEQELRELNEVYGGIEVEERSFDPLPDGRYQVEVTEARVEHSKGTGRLQFTQVMRVIAPVEYAGRVTTKCTGLNTEVGLSIVKSDLHRMSPEGMAPPFDELPLSDLPSVTPLLIGTYLEVALVSKESDKGETYQNCYINKVFPQSGESNIIDPENLDF